MSNRSFRRGLGSLVWLGVPLLAWGAEPRPIGLVGVGRFDKPPKLDGVLDDPCWQRVPAAPCLYELRGGPPYPITKARATVKLGYDDQALYLGCFFYYDDPVTCKTDKWRDDWIHVVIDPYNVPGPAGGLDYVFYSGGLARVHRVGGGGRYEHVPDPKRTGAVKRGKDGWALEVRFPWEELGRRPQAGQVWSFALARHRVMANRATGKQWVDRSSLSPGGHERRQANQGFIVFGSRPVRVLQALARAAAERHGNQWDLLMDTARLAPGHGGGGRHVLVQVRRGVDECAAMLVALAEPSLDKELKALRENLKAINRTSDRAQARTKLDGLAARLKRRGAIMVRHLAKSK